jgi:excisionase family DNA binding protein
MGDPYPKAGRARPLAPPCHAMTNQLLTADQLADRWQVPKAHVYALTRRNEIPTVRLGKYYRYRLDQIEAYETADNMGVTKVAGATNSIAPRP